MRSSPFDLALNSLRVGTVYLTECTGTPKATMRKESITDRLGLEPHVRSSQASSSLNRSVSGLGRPYRMPVLLLS